MQCCDIQDTYRSTAAHLQKYNCLLDKELVKACCACTRQLALSCVGRSKALMQCVIMQLHQFETDDSNRILYKSHSSQYNSAPAAIRQACLTFSMTREQTRLSISCLAHATTSLEPRSPTTISRTCPLQRCVMGLSRSSTDGHMSSTFAAPCDAWRRVVCNACFSCAVRVLPCGTNIAQSATRRRWWWLTRASSTCGTTGHMGYFCTRWASVTCLEHNAYRLHHEVPKLTIIKHGS